MFLAKKKLNRRALLRGAGVAIALPVLDAMIPALAPKAWAASLTPRRFGVTYFPNGHIMQEFTPATVGTGFAFTPILKPLEPFRDSLLVLTNFTRSHAGSQVGDHAVSAAGFLTGVWPKRTEAEDVLANTSIDQIVAQRIGQETPLPSLELATEDFTGYVGACSPGFSCAYMNTISWRTPQSPLPMETNPRAAFERIFGDASSVQDRTASMQKQKSILDSVAEEAGELGRKLGARDRARLDDYLGNIREIERRIQRAEAHRSADPTTGAGPLTAPIGIPDSFEEHAGLMFDLVAAAFQADVTRVFTFMMSREISQRTYPQIGVTEQHHTVSHHLNNAAKMAIVAKINQYYAQLYSKFLAKLQSTADGDGSLLEHSLLVYGGGMGDSNVHASDPLPLVLAGAVGQGHRHVQVAVRTPVGNLWSTVAAALAAAVLSWGQDASLIEAVKAGDRTAALAAIKRPGAVNAREADGTTALHWAVRSNDLALSQALLRAGADAKAVNRYGVTPLSLAVINGNAAMVDTLLKAGAAGETILMTAARAGNPAVMRLLLAHSKADANARESAYGETALMWAAAENHADAAQLLIEHGAEINARSQLMNYPKDRFGLEGVISILPHGYWTPLMYAARQGSLGTLRVLVKAGADLNMSDPDGTTALVFAIINSHYDAARLLLEAGANPNLADTAGMAALYATVDASTLGEIYGRPGKKVVNDTSAQELMNVLLAHGANPNAPLKSAALYRAHTPGEPALGEGATPLMRAAKNGDVATMRLLLDHGADPSLRQKNGTTALMLAAGMGRGLGVFAGDYTSDAQMLEAVRVLLARRVAVNAVNENGQTAVHFASLSMDPVVRLLAESGADLSIKDKNGRTALDFAMGGGGRGRGGAAPAVRQETAALIRELLNKR